MSKNKYAFAIALFLMATITVTLVALPAANAHDPPINVPTWVYAGVTPRITGVNQEALIVFWANWIPPTAGADSRFGDRWIFFVDITAPDGSQETLGGSTGFKSDPVGGTYTLFTPTQTGTYTIVVRMPEYKITGLPSESGIPINSPSVNDTYGPSESEPIYLTVQEEPIPLWDEAPLPTDYWTRPINTASREWYVLGSNWLGGAAQGIAPGYSAYALASFFGPPVEPYSHGPGPESAHILWTKPYYAGGIMDEVFGNTGYETAHYQGINLGAPIIIQGKLIVDYRSTAHRTNGWMAIDLYSGETLSFDNDTSKPAFGQIYNYESPNQHGGFPYVWRTSGVSLPEGDITERGKQTWEMIDGYTLQSVTKIANVSAGGTYVYGKDGSILRYSLATTDDVQYLRVWNSSAIPSLLGGTTGTNFWQWRPEGGAFGFGALPLGYYVHDGNQAWSLNVSISPAVEGDILTVREGEYVIGGFNGKNDDTGVEQGTLWSLSLAHGEEGKLLWTQQFTPPESIPSSAAGSGLTSYGVTMGSIDPEDGVFLFEERMTLERWGYSLDTMQPLWGPSVPEEPFSFYGLGDTIYEGKLLSYGYGGQMRAYNITTGEILWTYNATSVGDESAYGGLYPIGIACIAEDKIYTVSSEHSPTQPLYRGPNLRCINATDGSEVWSILFWGARMSPTESDVYIADGIIVGLNYFDMELYAFGKGPSATTVTASPEVSVHGDSVLIKGTITDQTATGRRNTNDNFDFSLKDTPAISDEDQSAWMEYMFMQQGKPENAKGVPVVLETLDPNGNFYEIGRTTSDETGAYGYAFTPEVPGLYTIFATFEGSNSYYGSNAITYINVAEAPQATPTPTPPPASMTDTYVIGFGSAALIAIIVIGVILILLRKR